MEFVSEKFSTETDFLRFKKPVIPKNKKVKEYLAFLLIKKQWHLPEIHSESLSGILEHRTMYYQMDIHLPHTNPRSPFLTFQKR